MPTPDNQNVTDYRSQFIGRLNSKFPDRKYVGQEGQEGQEALDDMYQSALEMFDEYDAKGKEYEDNNKRLLDLMSQDPTAAEFINTWATTGDPVKALTSIFGSEKIKAAIESEEGRKSMEEGEKEYLKGISDNKQAEEKRDAEFGRTLESLNAWGSQKGLDDSGKLEIISKLIGVGSNALEGKFTEEDFNMAYNAIHHDADVQSAREAGAIDGKNEKIREFRKEKAQGRPSVPTFSSQSAPMTPPKPAKRISDGDTWEL